MVDACLPANRGIHLSKQRGWHLDKVCAAQKSGGRKARNVTDHTTTQSNEDSASFMLFFQRGGKYLVKSGYCFELFAIRKRNNAYFPVGTKGRRT